MNQLFESLLLLYLDQYNSVVLNLNIKNHKAEDQVTKFFEKENNFCKLGINVKL